MDLLLSDKTALITAASKGIGFGAAMALAEEGCAVIIASSDEDNIRAAKAEIENKTGSTVDALTMDMTDLTDIAAGVAQILDRHKTIDIAVLNAPGPKPMAALEADDDTLLSAMTTNMVGQAAVCRLLVPSMIERGFGRVIALTSSTAKEPDEGMVLSNAARAGMIAYAKTLSREVAEHGVTVNSILTGGVMSARTEFLLRGAAEAAGEDYERFLEKAAQSTPSRHIPTPAEFAPTLVYLASPLSQCLNGVSLPIDGGSMRAL